MKQKDNKNSSISCMSLCVMLIVIIHIIALMGMMACSTHRHAVTVEREMHTDTVCMIMPSNTQKASEDSLELNIPCRIFTIFRYCRVG